MNMWIWHVGVVVWIRNVRPGLEIWTLGSQLVAIFGEVLVVQPCSSKARSTSVGVRFLPFLLVIEGRSSKLPALFLCHLLPCLPTVRDFSSSGTVSQIDTSFDMLPWAWCFRVATEKYLGTTCKSTCPGGGLARVWESQNKWGWASPSLLFTSAHLQPAGLAFWLSSSQILPPVAVQRHL